jgi:hypothetical protein
MVDENKTGKYIARTIALPGLLVISLLAAWLVMQSKTGIRMSGPIELDRSGLSVSMPSGNGWKCDEKWVFEDNSLNISSIFAVSGRTERSYAQCRYLLAADEETAKERLEQEYSGTNLVVTGQSTADSLTIDWATINTDSGVEIILGVCKLNKGRQLEIEVLQTASEQEMAKEIFEKIVNGIQFSDNGLLQAGARLISTIRAEGLDIGEDDSEKQSTSFFTITDSHNKTIGFTMDAMILEKTDSNTVIKAADYYYLRGASASEQVGYFRGSSDLQQFIWRVETISGTGRKGIVISADSGLLSIRRLRTGSPLNRRTGKETGEYELSETAVPDIALDPILKKAMDGNTQAIVIDIIRSDGIISPIYIEKMSPGKEQAEGDSIKIEWLDGRNYRQECYYDSSNKTEKIVLTQENAYTLNRTDANEIAKIFPERASLVNNKKQLLDHEGL